MSSLDNSYEQIPIWRSFEELEGDPEFIEKLKDEFPDHEEDLKDPLNRRRFFQLMGASMAMAGMVSTGCRRWEKDKVVPRDERNGFIPGVPMRYTSAIDIGGVAAGLLVTAYDGRPIKIEGNPAHPYTGTPAADGPRRDWNHGPTTAFAQASVLQVYDPDRSTGILAKGSDKAVPFKQFKKLLDRLFVPMQYLPEKWAREAAAKKAEAEKAQKAKEKAAKEKAAKEAKAKGIVLPVAKKPAAGADATKPAAGADATKPDAVAGAPAPKPVKEPVPPPPVSDTKVRFLCEASSSPTLTRLKAAAVAAYPGSKLYEWEPLTRDNERVGTTLAFGKPMRPLLHLDKADVIVSLDADLFINHPSALHNAAGFGSRRDPDATTFKKGTISGKWNEVPVQMNRLYVAESVHSQTGAVADHREPVRADQMGELADELRAAYDGKSAGTALGKKPEIKKFVSAIIADIKSARSAVVVAGYRLPPEVHAAVAYINTQKAGSSKDAGVSYVADPDITRKTHVEELKALVADIKAGACETLIIIGGNPVYDSPADIGFAAALAAPALKNTIHLSHYHNETSAKCSWHLNRAHYLEAWGDARTWDGTYTIAQPIIEPIHGGKSDIELLALLVGEDKKSGREHVHDTFAKLPNFKATKRGWVTALHDGHVPNTGFTHVSGLKAKIVPIKPVKTGDVELVLTASPHTFDGRFANNAWLQETPEFLSKMTWKNVLYIGPKTAKRKGLKNRTWATVKANGKSVRVGVYVLPGVADGTMAIALGHGRTRAGYVGGHAGHKVHSAGVDVYGLRHSNAMYVANATISGSSEEHRMPTTQGHWDVEPRARATIAKRMHELVKVGTKDAFAASKKPGKHGNRRRLFEHTPHNPDQINKSLFAPPSLYDKAGMPKWGMTTDLSKCIGCNACLVACQSENNIAVVGQEQVMRNREMNWIRIDTYFLGDPDRPEVVHQPVGCQQCENAPCEQVCPVGATVHSDEGLNDMVYNRCVGTRYCLNNCPYKVRRFNFLDFHGDDPSPLNAHGWKNGNPLNHSKKRNKLLKLAYNPNVTVRSRGVMEKCTFCVQRIQMERINAKNKAVQDTATKSALGEKTSTDFGPPIQDGKIQTACQQVCPTKAIVFGDLNDPNSKVYKAQYGETKKIDKVTELPVLAERAYQMMPELHTQPRNLYLARVKNPSPTLKPPAAKKGGKGGKAKH